MGTGERGVSQTFGTFLFYPFETRMEAQYFPSGFSGLWVLARKVM